MNIIELYWGGGVSALVLMATGWYTKLIFDDAEHMDVIGFAAVMLVLGFLMGIAL